MGFVVRVKDTFELTGRGRAVTGFIESGEVRVGDRVMVTRTGARATVRAVDGVLYAGWRPGDDAPVGLILPDLSSDQVAAGDVLTDVLPADCS